MTLNFDQIAGRIKGMLHQAVEDEGLVPLSRRLEIPIGQIRSILSGHDPKYSTMARVAQALDADWSAMLGPLQPATAEPNANHNSLTAIAQSIARLEAALPISQQGHEQTAGQLAESSASKWIATEHSAEIAHYGRIAAGGGLLPDDSARVGFEEQPIGTTDPPPGIKVSDLERWGGMISFSVEGSSMEPRYCDGDIVYVYADDPLRTDPDRLIGKDCIVTMAEERDGEAYLKQIRGPDNRKRGYFNLISLNPQWPTMANQRIHIALPIRYVQRQI